MLCIRLESSTALLAEVARAPASRRSAFALAHASPHLPGDPFRKIAGDNFFPIIRIRAMVNRERFRQRIAGSLAAAETTQKLERTRFRLD